MYRRQFLLAAALLGSGLAPALAQATPARWRTAAALPITDAECVFSDGLIVPLKSPTKAGKAKVKATVVADDGRKDVDTVKLVCNPAP